MLDQKAQQHFLVSAGVPDAEWSIHWFLQTRGDRSNDSGSWNATDCSRGDHHHGFERMNVRGKCSDCGSDAGNPWMNIRHNQVGIIIRPDGNRLLVRIGMDFEMRG